MGISLDALVLGISLFLVVSAGNILTPLLPLVQREFAVDYTTAGALVSAYGFARLMLDLPAAFLEQRFGSARLAAGGILVGVAGALLTATGPRFELVVLGRILMGLGASIIALVVLTALSTIAPPHARSRVLTVYSMANNLAIAFFPVVGGIVGATWGWRSTMWVCAGLTCIGAVLLAWVFSRMAAQKRAGKAVAAGPEVSFELTRGMLVAIATVYLGVIVYMVNRHGFRNTALPLFAHDRLGLDPLAIASGITVMSLVGIVVAIPAAIVADRWNKRLVIAAGFVVLAVGDFSFFGASNYVTFLLASVLLGAGDFFAASQTAALTELSPVRLRSRILGAYRFSSDLGAAIGPLVVAGLLQFAGYERMIVILCVLLLLAALTAWIGARVSGHLSLGSKGFPSTPAPARTVPR